MGNAGFLLYKYIDKTCTKFISNIIGLEPRPDVHARHVVLSVTQSFGVFEHLVGRGRQRQRQF